MKPTTNKAVPSTELGMGALPHGIDEVSNRAHTTESKNVEEEIYWSFSTIAPHS
jgi:hypothetical protein